VVLHGYGIGGILNFQFVVPDAGIGCRTLAALLSAPVADFSLHCLDGLL
jgi:hypothetical protein